MTRIRPKPRAGLQMANLMVRVEGPEMVREEWDALSDDEKKRLFFAGEISSWVLSRLNPYERMADAS